MYELTIFHDIANNASFHIQNFEYVLKLLRCEVLKIDISETIHHQVF